MAKCGKKSKNKRVTLKKKSKILKKVKEHHQKKAKEAKKVQTKQKTDRSIQNEAPFTEEEIRAVEDRRARAFEEFEMKKVAHRDGLLLTQKKRPGSVDAVNSSKLEKQGFGEVKVNGELADFVRSRDNSDRAFYKELVKVIEASDVILEVLDARDPLGSRCADMEKLVMKSGPNKHLVLLLNKIDLVPREAAERWLKYLREELPTVAFKCSTQEQRSNLGWKSSKASSKPSNILQTSDCLGAETLIKLLKNYSRSHEIKKSITVGIVGLPNVGKSSLINSLKRCHVVNVGATPGLTRSMQEVQLDKNVKLLDCPGVVMLKSAENSASVALRNCKRIEKLEDPISPVKEILKLCPAQLLITLYKIQSFDSVEDFLYKVATIRGKLKKGGIVDVEATARIILHDWNEGKIPYYTMPPTRDQGGHAEAKIITELGKEFNIDEVYDGESSFIGSLKTADDFHPIDVTPSCSLTFDQAMLVEQPAPTDISPEEMSDDGDDQATVVEEDEGKTREKSATSRQNEKLYSEEGILNTRMKRAEKKRRKKASKSTAVNDSMVMDTDNHDLKSAMEE